MRIRYRNENVEEEKEEEEEEEEEWKKEQSHLAFAQFFIILCVFEFFPFFIYPSLSSLICSFRILFHIILFAFFYEDLFCSLRHDANLLRHIMIIVKSFSTRSISYFSFLPFRLRDVFFSSVSNTVLRPSFPPYSEICSYCYRY